MMPKFPRSKPAGRTRQQNELKKNNVRIHLDCQLFTKTMYPEMQETACFMKDC